MNFLFVDLGNFLLVGLLWDDQEVTALEHVECVGDNNSTCDEVAAAGPKVHQGNLRSATQQGHVQR